MNHRLATTEAERAVDYRLLKVSSAAFAGDGFIPSKYTCDGVNVNPPLKIEHIPEETISLVLIVEDPDAPAKPWTHWIAWNIPVTHHIKENEAHGMEGRNDFGKTGYGGPCPPYGTHRYLFKVYALNSILDLPPDITRPELEKKISPYIIAFGELAGLYKRNK